MSTLVNRPRLHAPLHIGRLELPNRVVMPPLVVWKATDDGIVTPALLEHYRRSAGPGLVIVEATAVSPEGRLAREQIGIFEDRHIEGLSRIAAIIRAAGAAASIQLHHAGRNTTLENTFGLPLVAPSAVAAKDVVPEALSEEGIERILGCFATAARRAADAGFDAVEIHGAHGYLASQFLSPLANRRDDRWGGSLENRARFVREAARRMREAVGGRLLVSCRLGAADGDPSGLTVDEGIQVAQWLESDGMPFIHVSTGIGSAPKLAPEGSPWSDRLLLGAAVKKAVGIPVIGIGGIIDPDQAERALAEGLVDLVAVGRAMLADPEWSVKTLAGRDDEIWRCRQCRICQHFRHAERCPARKEAAEVGHLRTQADRLRRDVVEMIGIGKAGHLGGSCSLAEIAAALYFSRMRFDPKNIRDPDRDRFILSKGHAVLIQYAALVELGVIPREEIARTKTIEGMLQGHPDMERTPGIEAVTGSLGQGLSIGVGMALALRLDRKPARVWVIMGDGELSEGQLWEAAMAAAAHGLGNLTGIVDRNRIQATGPTAEVLAIPAIERKWEAFGWSVQTVDGHDVAAVLRALDAARKVTDRPSLIVADTVKGKGVSFAENTAAFHNGIMTREQYGQALAEIDARLAAGGAA